MNGTVLLQTERLYLRYIDSGDADDFFEFASAIETAENAGFPPVKTADEGRAVTEKLQSGVYGEVFAVCLKPLGKMIGAVMLKKRTRLPVTHSAEIGYVLSGRYRGNGYMTEAAKAVVEYAFSESGFSAVCAACAGDNRRSQRVLEKLGFALLLPANGEKIPKNVYVLLRAKMLDGE